MAMDEFPKEALPVVDAVEPYRPVPRSYKTVAMLSMATGILALGTGYAIITGRAAISQTSKLALENTQALCDIERIRSSHSPATETEAALRQYYRRKDADRPCDRVAE